MNTFTPATPPCSPLCGKHRNSFAFTTITKRLPVILAKTVDDLVRSNYELYGKTTTKDDQPAEEVRQEKREEAKKLLNKLGELRYELQRDRKLTAIESDSDGDSDIWNQLLKEYFPNGSWLSVPWLVSECYMYRRVRGFFAQSIHWQTYDPFARQKQEALEHSATSINLLVKQLHAILRDAATSDITTQQKAFFELATISLWGNRTDLSLLPDLNAEQAADLQASKTAEDAHHHTIANDLDDIWTLVATLKNNSGRAQKVYLHAKSIPWFVSDVIKLDLDWMLDALIKLECFTTLSNSALLAEMVGRWRSHLASGRWSLETNTFWTTPYAFWHLPTQAPQLWQELQQSSLCIYKGDLNYRKLVYDCSWAPDTPFTEAIGPLHTSAGAPPLVALRTCKADIVVGLETGKSEVLSLSCPDWMVNGEYAVIQLSKP
ncbi:hypothetical protein BDF19DRAFT_429775 [Syncephalis fuscata]|nr:hypothetical protein BDF19DRAFT_429775 [Syncephalis fuscata]